MRKIRIHMALRGPLGHPLEGGGVEVPEVLGVPEVEGVPEEDPEQGTNNGWPMLMASQLARLLREQI